MDETSNNRKRQIIATLAVLIVIVAIVAAATLTGQDSASTNSSNTTSTSQKSNANYADGTYSAEGGYNSPGGAETITIEVTLRDNIITETSAESGATSTEAEGHQADFIAAYEDLVVGKKIGDIELSRVAGSSLTSIGFNNALEQIKADAEV